MLIPKSVWLGSLTTLNPIWKTESDAPRYGILNSEKYSVSNCNCCSSLKGFSSRKKLVHYLEIIGNTRTQKVWRHVTANTI